MWTSCSETPFTGGEDILGETRVSAGNTCYIRRMRESLSERRGVGSSGRGIENVECLHTGRMFSLDKGSRNSVNKGQRGLGRRQENNAVNPDGAEATRGRIGSGVMQSERVLSNSCYKSSAERGSDT